MVVTDLDGTLLDSSSGLSAGNREALVTLGERGRLRVVATGRSLYSARRVMDVDFPVDYLIFSTGAGIVDWSTGRLLRARHLSDSMARTIADRLRRLDLDFMVHGAVPDNHHFLYHRSGRPNPDFERRRCRYARYAAPLLDGLPPDMVVSQFLVVEPPQAASCHEALRSALDGANVIRATSPLDHRSRWIEIFPPDVSKSLAADWVRRRHAVAPQRIHAIGNDYNDTDLLEWAANAYVVDNAVEALKQRFAVVASNDEDGFAQAASLVDAPPRLD